MAREAMEDDEPNGGVALPYQSDDDLSDAELSDAQIQQLLRDAESRLRDQAANKADQFNFRLPKLEIGDTLQPYIKTSGKVAEVDEARLDKEVSKKAAGSRPIRLEDPVIFKQNMEKAKKASTGPDWFNLPKTDLTPALKRDLQLLKMRNVLDPHRHYKKDGSRTLAPEYSQVGTIVEGPTDFFNARLEKRERKETFADEVLAGEQNTGRFKKKYGEIQTKKTSGKKAHYKALMEKRKKSFKR